MRTVKSNWSLNTNTQQQEAASRQVLRAGRFRRSGCIFSPVHPPKVGP
jgi:hypothetical protein